MFCTKNNEMKSLINNKKDEIKNIGIKNMETFLDYSLVDNKKYPPIQKNKCRDYKDNLHISFYQRDTPSENGWVFNYPHYRNYIGGASGLNH